MIYCFLFISLITTRYISCPFFTKNCRSNFYLSLSWFYTLKTLFVRYYHYVTNPNWTSKALVFSFHNFCFTLLIVSILSVVIELEFELSGHLSLRYRLRWCFRLHRNNDSYISIKYLGWPILPFWFNFYPRNLCIYFTCSVVSI